MWAEQLFVAVKSSVWKVAPAAASLVGEGCDFFAYTSDRLPVCVEGDHTGIFLCLGAVHLCVCTTCFRRPG